MIERVTRSNGMSLGLLLGAANAAVIALGVTALEGHGATMVLASAVFMVGVVPALIAGLMIGCAADHILSWPVSARRAALVVSAWLAVVVFGYGLGMPELIILACIPSTAAAVVLERRTRSESPAVEARVVVR